MNKAKVYGLLILVGITLLSSTKAKAEIKDTSWISDNMVKIVDNTIPMEVGVIGESSEKLGYWNMSEKSNHYIVPIRVEHSGKLIITIKADNINAGRVNCGLYKDVKLQNVVESTGNITKSSPEIVEKYVLTKGTYYIALEKSEKAKGTNIKGIIGASVIRSDDRDVEVGNMYCGYITEDNKSITYKIKTEADGYISIITNKDMWAKLKDKDKKDITYRKKLSGASKYSESFALPKGTYYIEIQGEKGEFVVGSIFTDSVKLDKTVHNLNIGTEEKAIIGYDGVLEDKYWIKVDVKKPTKLQLNSSWLGGSGQLNFKIVYNGSTKMYFNEYCLSQSKANSIIRMSGEKEWPAGTYYICIQKQNDMSSGVISLKLERLN